MAMPLWYPLRIRTIFHRTTSRRLRAPACG
uniref:Uncharacterized protein n=1 Tax=Arundo donax TaxID=35708 RepID=A0A0A9E0N2_ARUDO